METRLKNSICTLKNLHDTYHSQLDSRTVTELKAVIADLEAQNDQTKKMQRQDIGLRTLQIMARIIAFVSNIKDLM
jgi:hypothetical protein